MSSESRKIDDILSFRSDISPFLVHLTRSVENWLSAEDALEKIIKESRLICGNTLMSDAKYGIHMNELSEMSLNQRRRFFSAICLTETPLSEVHCLLNIAYRKITLEPYGLVFLKERLIERGVAPVLYLNNEMGDKDKVFQDLCSLCNDNPNEAEQVLPLVAVFGQKIQAPGVSERKEDKINFMWEREWRYPSVKAPLDFTDKDVFIGLCPHEKIEKFEDLFKPVDFIDPTRNMKWYATKLIEARRRLKLKFSVV